MIKVAIDCRPIAWTGIGTYLKGLIPNLRKYENVYEFYLLINPMNQSSYALTGFKTIIISSKPFSFLEQIEIPYILTRERIDIYYATFINIPLFLSKKIWLITSVYDLAITHVPTNAKSIFHKLYYHLFIRSLLRKSKVVIAQSEYTKNDLQEYFHAINVHVIYPGFDMKRLDHEISDNKIKLKFGISKPYFLYVGVNKPHKNLKTLVQAFININLNNQHQLVIAGTIDNSRYDIVKHAEQFNNINNIILTDFVSDEELGCLYKNAYVYVSPAFLESGYSYPILEAQSFGVPVIASQKDLSEFLGESAYLFDPESVESLSFAMKCLIEDSVLRNKLIQRGKLNLMKYTNDNAARLLIEAINNAFH